MDRMKKVRLLLGLIIIITIIVAYQRAFIDFNYLTIIINKFTLIGNLIIGLGLILMSLGKLKSDHYIHLILIAWLIFIVVFGIFRESLFGAGWNGAILHYFVPLILLFDFFFLYKDYRPNYKDIYKVTIIPIIYLVYILIYGLFTGMYPYGFIDLNLISITEFMATVFILLIIYCFSGFLFISTYIIIRKVTHKK